MKYGDIKTIRPRGPWITTCSDCGKSWSPIRRILATYLPCMALATNSHPTFRGLLQGNNGACLETLGALALAHATADRHSFDHLRIAGIIAGHCPPPSTLRNCERSAGEP